MILNGRGTSCHQRFKSEICHCCAAVDYNGQAAEHGLRSSADQEVPHPDVLPEQSTGDFDFNEFFNLEKTMPGLASVSTGNHCLVLLI